MTTSNDVEDDVDYDVDDDVGRRPLVGTFLVTWMTASDDDISSGRCFETSCDDKDVDVESNVDYDIDASVNGDVGSDV